MVDNRTKVEAKVSTIVSENDADNTATRSALEAGVETTRNLTAAQSKRELEAAAAATVPPSTLNDVAPKDAKAWYGPFSPTL
jgi:hypothetical protein